MTGEERERERERRVFEKRVTRAAPGEAGERDFCLCVSSVGR